VLLESGLAVSLGEGGGHSLLGTSSTEVGAEDVLAGGGAGAAGPVVDSGTCSILGSCGLSLGLFFGSGS
jgi:hypothetical protein